MRHFKFIIFTAFLVVLMVISFVYSPRKTTLNSDYVPSSKYINEKDFQYMYFTQGASSIIAESKDGYYFFSGYYLYYADKKNMNPVILCNKPNCLHDQETDPSKVANCNAFVIGPDDFQFLAYYDGDLYATSTVFGKTAEEYELIKISLDGTKRKSILKFDVPPISIVIHRGKVYYTQTAYDENQKSIYQIKQFNLESPFSKPQEIYVGNLDGGSIQDLLAYDNNLYFVEFAHNADVFTTRVMRYDILSGKTSRMFTTDDSEFAGIPTIYDNHLYYYVNKYNVDGTIKEAKTYLSDLDGKNEKERFNVDYISNVLGDKQNLYIVDVFWSPDARPKDKQSITIVDKNGNMVDEIKTGSVENFLTVIPGGDEHLFITTNTDEFFKIYYVDKKQFGTGKAKLNTFFQIEKDRMTPGVLIQH